jgi:vacuolar-type H+-ATPase subunit I/STV1
MNSELETAAIVMVVLLLKSLAEWIAARFTAKARNAPTEVELENREKSQEIKRRDLVIAQQETQIQTERKLTEMAMLQMQQNVNLQNQLTVTNDQYSQAKTMIDHLQDEIAKRDLKSRERDKEIETLNDKVKELDQLRQQVRELELLRVKVRELEAALKTKDKELAIRDAKIAQLEQRIVELEHPSKNVLPIGKADVGDDEGSSTDTSPLDKAG